ncbi:MAG TPA: efflux transporter outer membrane subunit [Burkholderiales bacterium]|jgi:NodT family efflux transporter outer membrane factor (OMF) lipoprotein
MKAWPTILLAIVAGCTMGPDYRRPETPAVEAFSETPEPWKVAQPRDDIARGNWWEVFGDPQLNDLITKIDVSNQTLAASEAQFRQTLAALGISRAALFPTLDANATVVRSHSPGSTLGGTTAGRTVTSYGGRFTAQWEIDLWGRVRRSVESAEAAARASSADVGAARLSLQAQLATSYFQLRSLDAQARLLDDTVGALRKSLELTENRYRAGVVARSDVVQADAQLKSTLVQTIDLGVQRAQLEHAIAVLTGVPPAQLRISRSDSFETEVPIVPPGVPSALLERRPDVAAAERRVHASNAQIGVAKAAYFPQITLTGVYGATSPDVSLFFVGASRTWSIGPSIAQSIFDAGLRRSQTEQAIAAYDATVANYRQVTLTAFQEVEDNLAALRILEEEARSEADAVEAARLSLSLVLNQYKAGTVSFLNVVTAQTALLNEERNAVGIQVRRLAAVVALIKALGGGWHEG